MEHKGGVQDDNDEITSDELDGLLDEGSDT